MERRGLDEPGDRSASRCATAAASAGATTILEHSPTPHCETELPEIYMRKPQGPFGVGRGFVFFCPHCRKVMGFGTHWYPFPG